MKPMLLSEIAVMLRKCLDEDSIVRAIKNREIKEIENNGYTEQHNYPHGVYVYARGEDIDGIMFGHRPMTSDELKHAQSTLGLTNQQLADRLRVSLRAVEMWRQGSRPVPGPVAAFLEHLTAA